MSDTRVKRGAELTTDHYLVVSALKTKPNIITKQHNNIKPKRETTKLYRLAEESIAHKYREAIEEEIQAHISDWGKLEL